MILKDLQKPRMFLGSIAVLTSDSGQIASKGHKVKDGALKVALSPIATCALLPTGGGDNASRAAAKVTLKRSITT